jgi:hypothetical protein
MPDSRRKGNPEPSPMQVRTLFAVAIVGGITTGGAYVISGGSIPLFVGVMVGVGLLARLGARVLMARQGRRPPKGWWL